MKSIRITLWGLLGGISLLWLLANLPFPDTLDIMALRDLAIQYTGVLAIGAMSVAMMLATRSRLADRWLNGLDKSYRLHKWLGIAALVTAVLHWGATSAPKWAATLGLIQPPDRSLPSGEMPDLGAVQSFLNGLHGPAGGLGEQAFYLAVLLIAVALIRRIPYRLFAKTHTLIALAYLVLVFHSVVLMDFDAWTQPLGIFTALLMLGGVVSAGLALGRQIGRHRKVTGKIATLRHVPSVKITEAEISVDKGWSGHQAGQFAFVTFDRKEGPHPFTIASAWDPDHPSITFISKALGDFTERLPDSISVGDEVTIEGPYGRFTFEDDKDRQIWIGAGIGITPFIARLKHLANNPDSKTIDLFHTVPNIAEEHRAHITADAAAGGATLHLLEDTKHGLLTGARLRDTLPDWSGASIWFCGPAGFGEALRRDLVAHGLHPADFHQELFNLR